MTNYYKILGVKDFATPQEIKIAYRKLSKKFHPDLNDGDKFFEEKFKELQNAYETLIDNSRREIYDKDLNRFFNGFDNYEFKDKNRTENKEENKTDEPRNQNEQKKHTEYKNTKTHHKQKIKKENNTSSIIFAFVVFFLLMILITNIGSYINESKIQNSNVNNNNKNYMNQPWIVKFTITNGKDDNEDISNILIAQDAFIVFYTIENDELIYMANVWPKNNSQSYGPLYSVKPTIQATTYEKNNADLYSFNWKYSNDYNNKTGTAKVQVIKIYKPQGIEYLLKIIPENLKELEYKGNMDKIVDFSKLKNSTK